MTTHQKLNLDYLRGEARGIHKGIVLALKVQGGERQKLFEKAVANAQQLRANVEEAAAAHEAKRKEHLKKVSVQLAALIALRGANLKDKTKQIRDAANGALEHITEAIALARKHAAKPASKK